MSKPLITEAKNINAEVVLELGKFYSTKDLRGLQAKLTGTTREIHVLTSGNTLLGRIGQYLSAEQLQLLRDAAKLIESIGFNIEHAKEKRHRSEVATKKRQKDRDSQAQKIAASAYPLPRETLEQKLEIISLALILNRAGCFQPFYAPLELSLKFRNYVTETPRLIGWKSPNHFWTNKITSICSDLRNEIEQYIAFNDGANVHDRLHALQAKADALQAEVLNDPYEIKTLRLWSEALTSAEQQEVNQ